MKDILFVYCVWAILQYVCSISKQRCRYEEIFCNIHTQIISCLK